MTVAVLALEEYVHVALAQPTPDYADLMLQYRKLITLTLPTSSDTRYFDEILKMSATGGGGNAFQEQAEVGGRKGGMIPKVEAQWVVATAWNIAVKAYRIKAHAMAERFMSRAIELHKMLLGSNYPDQYKELVSTYQVRMCTG